MREMIFSERMILIPVKNFKASVKEMSAIDRLSTERRKPLWNTCVHNEHLCVTSGNVRNNDYVVKVVFVIVTIVKHYD